MAGPNPTSVTKPKENPLGLELGKPKQPNMAAKRQLAESGKPTEVAVKQAIISLSAGPEIQLRKLGAAKVAEIMSSLTKQKVDHRYLWYNYRDNKATFALTIENKEWEQVQAQCSQTVQRDGTTYSTNVRPKIFLAVAQNIEAKENLPAFIEKMENDTGRKVISFKRIGKSKAVKVGFNVEPTETKIQFEGKWRKITPFDPNYKQKKKILEPKKQAMIPNDHSTPKTYAQAVGGQNNKKGQNEPNIKEKGRHEPNQTQENGLNLDQVKSIFKEMIEALVTPLITKLTEEIGALKRELGKHHSKVSTEEENTNEALQTSLSPIKGNSRGELQTPEKISPPQSPVSPTAEMPADPPTSPVSPVGESSGNQTPHTSPRPQSAEQAASIAPALLSHPDNNTPVPSNEIPPTPDSQSVTDISTSSTEKPSSQPSSTSPPTQPFRKTKKSRIPSPTQPSTNHVQLRPREKKKYN